MAKKKRKGGKRKMSAAQRAALEKGRKALAKKRGGPKRRKARPKKAARRKTAIMIFSGGKKRMAKRKARKGGGGGSFRRKARRAASRARGFLGKAGGAMGVMKEGAFAVAGGIAAGVLANKLPIADPRIKAAAPIAAGLAIAATIGRRNEIAKGISTGMVVLGMVALFKQLAPNIPMLAGEDEVLLIPNAEGGYTPVMGGEMLRLGQDYYPEDEEIAAMGETVSLGQEAEEEYRSPANF